MIIKAKKRPVVVEAVHLKNNNRSATMKWCGAEWVDEDGSIFVPARPAPQKAAVGDYIVKSLNGQFSVVRSDEFLKTYEFIEEK